MSRPTDQIAVSRMLEPGSKLLLSKQHDLDKLLIVALIVHQLPHHLQHRSFQELRLVDDYYQSFPLVYGLLFQKSAKYVHQLEVATVSLRHLELLDDFA